MAKRKSTIDDIIEITTRLPGWVGILLAVVSYMLLHAYATSEAQSIDLRDGSGIAGGLFKSIATIGQYIFPAVFALGAIGSLIKRKKQDHLYSKASTHSPLQEISKMSWRDFEQLTAAAFRKKGYSVQDTNDGPDGGIDLVLKKNGEVYLVQCKHWLTYKVGVKVIRELYGVMASRGVVGGFVVTAGEYTKEARGFAEGINIELIDGAILEEWLTLKEQGQLLNHHEQVYGENIPQIQSSLEDSLLKKRTSERNRSGIKVATTVFAIFISIGAFYGLYYVANDQLEKVITSGMKGNSKALATQNNSKSMNSMERSVENSKKENESVMSRAEIYIPGQSNQHNMKSFNELYQTPLECLASPENPNPDMISCANQRIRAMREYNNN